MTRALLLSLLVAATPTLAPGEVPAGGAPEPGAAAAPAIPADGAAAKPATPATGDDPDAGPLAIAAPLAEVVPVPLAGVDAASDAISPAGLLSRDLNDTGNVLVRWLRSDGAIVVREVTPAGRIEGEATDGSVLDLPAVGGERSADGRIHVLVQDAYGAVLGFVLDDDGAPADARIVRDSPGL
jgi:hypothetical protein